MCPRPKGHGPGSSEGTCSGSEPRRPQEGAARVTGLPVSPVGTLGQGEGHLTLTGSLPRAWHGLGPLAHCLHQHGPPTLEGTSLGGYWQQGAPLLTQGVRRHTLPLYPSPLFRGQGAGLTGLCVHADRKSRRKPWLGWVMWSHLRCHRALAPAPPPDTRSPGAGA